MDKIATFDDLGLGVRHEMRTFDRFRTTENLNKRVHGRNCSSSRRERERVPETAQGVYTFLSISRKPQQRCFGKRNRVVVAVVGGRAERR